MIDIVVVEPSASFRIISFQIHFKRDTIHRLLREKN